MKKISQDKQILSMTNDRDIYLKQIAEVQLELQRQDGLVQQAKLDQIQLVAKRKQMIKEKQERHQYDITLQQRPQLWVPEETLQL